MYIDLEAKGGNPNGPMDWDGVGGREVKKCRDIFILIVDSHYYGTNITL